MNKYYRYFTVPTTILIIRCSRAIETVITCVTEVQITGIKTCLLAIGVQCAPVGGMLYIFSVAGSRIIRRIEVIDKVTSCSFISPMACRVGYLQQFDGCVAVGTDLGKVILLDLKATVCQECMYSSIL